jgi:type VI secretion system protein ImpH
VPVAIEEFVGHSLLLAERQRTFLGRQHAAIGMGAVAGSRVWDRQYKFRVHLGPLTLSQYESFLPGGEPLTKLVDWVRLYTCFELQWDVRLSLRKDEVPPVKLGRAGRLGWTTWLGHRRQQTDADDLCLDAEKFVERMGERAA